MTHDTLYRYAQALDPSALTIIAGAAHALSAAISDCHAATVDPEGDPAVILLARHLGRVADPIAARDHTLRLACAERIIVLRSSPFERARSAVPAGPIPPRIAA